MSDLTSTNPNEPKISYTLNDLEVRSRHSLFHDAKIANLIVLSNLLAIFFLVILYQLSSSIKIPISVLPGLILIPAS